MTNPPAAATVLDPYMQAVVDHDAGLHDSHSPPQCSICNPRAKPAHGNLDEYFARILATMVVDHTPIPESEPRSEFDGGPLCDRCHGLRRLRVERSIYDADFGKLMPCPDCVEVTTSARLVKLLGALPERMLTWTLDTFPTHNNPVLIDYLARVREWASVPDDPTWLFLGGLVGHGKTGLGVGAMRALAEAGVGCAFVTVPDLLDSIRQTFGKGNEAELTYAETMHALRTVSLLFLDDFGKEKTTDWASEKLFQLINARHGEQKRTIITSNLTFRELADKLDDSAIPSRIGEACGTRYHLSFTDTTPLLRPGGHK